MSLPLILFGGFITILLLTLGWAQWRPQEGRKLHAELHSFAEDSESHITYLPQIRQALAKADYDFLSERAPRGLQRRVRRERRSIAHTYLAALREDFQSLLRMAKVIATLSPEVVAVQEFERLRLTAQFRWRYQMIRWRLLAGLAPMAQLDHLSALVSGLSVRMEAAVKELGERAALAADLASSIDGRGLDAG